MLCLWSPQKLWEGPIVVSKAEGHPCTQGGQCITMERGENDHHQVLTALKSTLDALTRVAHTQLSLFESWDLSDFPQVS